MSSADQIAYIVDEILKLTGRYWIPQHIRGIEEAGKIEQQRFVIKNG